MQRELTTEESALGLNDDKQLSACCLVCKGNSHFCITKDCGIETGHYGKRPASYCDDCRHKNIMRLGRPLDEQREERLN